MSEMPATMQCFGYAPDMLSSELVAGFVGQAPCPKGDGLRRGVVIYLHDPRTRRRTAIGGVVFDGDGRQVESDMSGIADAVGSGWLPADPRVIAFVGKYPSKLPDLGALQLQREYPVQIPFFGPLVLMPGDVEVL